MTHIKTEDPVPESELIRFSVGSCFFILLNAFSINLLIKLNMSEGSKCPLCNLP